MATLRGDLSSAFCEANKLTVIPPPTSISFLLPPMCVLLCNLWRNAHSQPQHAEVSRSTSVCLCTLSAHPPVAVYDKPGWTRVRPGLPWAPPVASPSTLPIPLKTVLPPYPWDSASNSGAAIRGWARALSALDRSLILSRGAAQGARFGAAQVASLPATRLDRIRQGRRGCPPPLLWRVLATLLTYTLCHASGSGAARVSAAAPCPCRPLPVLRPAVP